MVFRLRGHFLEEHSHADLRRRPDYPRADIQRDTRNGQAKVHLGTQGQRRNSLDVTAAAADIVRFSPGAVLAALEYFDRSRARASRKSTIHGVFCHKVTAYPLISAVDSGFAIPGTFETRRSKIVGTEPYYGICQSCKYKLDSPAGFSPFSTRPTARTTRRIGSVPCSSSKKISPTLLVR